MLELVLLCIFVKVPRFQQSLLDLQPLFHFQGLLQYLDLRQLYHLVFWSGLLHMFIFIWALSCQLGNTGNLVEKPYHQILGSPDGSVMIRRPYLEDPDGVADRVGGEGDEVAGLGELGRPRLRQVETPLQLVQHVLLGRKAVLLKRLHLGCRAFDWL